MAGLVLLMVGLAAIHPVTNWWGDREFARAVEELKARGYPMTLDEAFGPHPSRSENFLHHPAFLAELSFRDPDRRLSQLSEIGITRAARGGYHFDFSGSESVKEMDRGAAADVLAALAPLEPRRRALLDALQNSAPCAPRASRDHEADTPKLDVYFALNLLKFLRDHAVLSLANGATDAALEDILAALKLSKSLRHPYCYNREEAFAEDYGRGAIARAVLDFPKPGWTEPQLAALDAALSAVDLPAERATLIRGIPAEFRALHDGIRSGKVVRYQLSWRAIWQDRDWTRAGWERKGRQLLDLATPRGVDQLAAAKQLRQLADVLDALDPAGPLAAVELSCNQLRDALRPWSYPYLHNNRDLPLEFPGPEKAQVTYDAARHVVAVERHRLRHGRFPAGRESLDPEFGRDLPDGAPGRCRWNYRLAPAGDLEIEATPPAAVGPVSSIRLTRP